MKEKIELLRKEAEKQGLKIRFRKTPTDQGDFCIFIYDPSFRKGYAVGFDGDNTGEGVSFDQCLSSAYRWLEKRDKRFILRDDRWQYGRYHFVLWKDGNGKDSDHYLTIDDADKAAEIFVSQGYCVVCYDQNPNGTYTFLKVYGDYNLHCNDFVKNLIKKRGVN